MSENKATACFLYRFTIIKYYSLRTNISYFFGQLTIVFFAMLFFASISSCWSQNIYNLPPGESVPSDFVYVDYSYKLDQISISNEVINIQNENFPSFITRQELERMKLEEFDMFKYYVEAFMFYEKLSNHAKVLFSIDELWYIYKYDLRLKDLLELVIE
jgi:hypothetical protein